MKVRLDKRWCPECGKLVERRHPSARYCSHRCAYLPDYHPLRARELGVPGERIRALSIYRRDGFTCYLCLLPTEPMGDVGPMGPSLDHVVAMVAPNTPGHVPSNVRTAHRRCNSRKQRYPVTARLMEKLVTLPWGNARELDAQDWAHLLPYAKRWA